MFPAATGPCRHGRIAGMPGRLPRRDSERSQRVQDDGDVDQLLQERALHRRQVAEGGGDHPEDRQADPGRDALERDAARALGDLDPRQQEIEVIDQQDDIRGLGRGGRPARAHGDADVGGRERRGVVDPVAHHHHRAVLALGQDQQHLLVGGEVGPHGVEPEAPRSPPRPRRDGRRSPAGCGRCPVAAARRGGRRCPAARRRP